MSSDLLRQSINRARAIRFQTGATSEDNNAGALELRNRDASIASLRFILNDRNEKIRQLEAELAVAQVTNKKLVDEVAKYRTYLRVPIEVEQPLPWRPSCALIKYVVAEYYGYLVTDLDSPRRNGRLPFVRHVMFYLMRVLTNLSLPQIGKRVGDRDHTTIMHGVNRIEKQLADDPKLCDDIKVLTDKIAKMGASVKNGGNSEQTETAELASVAS